MNYSPAELHQLMTRTTEISNKPYRLLTAYIISELISLTDDDDEEEDVLLWERTMPAKLFKDTVYGCIMDFKDAAESKSKLNIFGSPFTIRNAGSLDDERLSHLVEIGDGEEIGIKPELFKNVEEESRTYEIDKARMLDNMLYTKKIIYLAERSDEDYDKLSNMEVCVYCWVLYIGKINRNKITPARDRVADFIDMYEDYFGLTRKEVESCLEENTKLDTPFAFSLMKVQLWNKENGQETGTNATSIKDSENYYERVYLKRGYY